MPALLALRQPPATITLNRVQIAAGEHARVGEQLTVLYRHAQDAEMAILRFGAAFWAVEQLLGAGDDGDDGGGDGDKAHAETRRRGEKAVEGFLTTCGQKPPKGGRPKGGFADWLREYAPEISRTTARRYRDLAKAIAEKFRIADPVLLFDAEPAALSEGDRKKRARVLDFVSEKSIRGMQLELGLAWEKNRDPVTGKRLHYPTRKTREELQQERLAAAHALAFALFKDFSGLGDRWMALSDGELTVALEFVETFVKKARKWLSTPPPSRAKYEETEARI